MINIREYKRWLAQDELDGELRTELTSLSGNDEEITERFYTSLEFGTAGLRGILGAGPNRMNVHVVRRATRGLALYVASHDEGASRGVVIAYDSRKYSRRFAYETARTLAAAGVKAYVFPSLRPVPMLSFAVRELHAMAGVVITASHNPPKYNGYKVYWEDGGQASIEQAAAIYARIAECDYFGVPIMEEAEARERGLLLDVPDSVDEAYYRATISLIKRPEAVKREGASLNIVYTPLHGAGLVPVTRVLSAMGMQHVAVVEEQREPDSAFPTVTAPNPEDKRVFALAEALADKTRADIILATDPDSDRLGVEVRRQDGAFEALTGNMTGALLLHFTLTALSEDGKLPVDGYVVKSLVSTRLADAIAKRFGVTLIDVPTGFRYISEKIEHSEKTGEGTFLFGFEESYGCLAGGFARDKDAVLASMLVCEAACFYKERNMTLADALDEMAELYGHFGERVKSYTLEGMAGTERIKNAMAKLRSEPPTAFGTDAVVSAEDMLTGKMTLSDGTVAKSAVSNVDVLRYTLASNNWLCVRPSGTEPKLKLYVAASAKDEAGLKRALDTLYQAAGALISRELE